MLPPAADSGRIAYRRPVGTASHLTAATALTLALAGCSVGDLDARGMPCPCPADLACDDATKTCVDRAASSTGAGAGAGAGGAGAGGAGAGGAPCTGPLCPIQVDGYDIDPTEVTNVAYQEFVDAAVDPTAQPGNCLWNTSFAPQTESVDCNAALVDPVTFPDRPITCIDVCDARAYCTWKGRRLCGRIGGGKLFAEDGADPEVSEWFRACTEAGVRAYPYGETFEAESCKTSATPGGGNPVEVRTFVDCEGGYTGLFDMSGNVQEWEDGCTNGSDPEDPADDSCNVRGGAFWSSGTEARCDHLMYRPPGNAVSNDWGFRCCGG
jgi:formylglycine-generating enzyme